MVVRLAVLLAGLVLTGCAPLALEERPLSADDPYDLDKHIVLLDGRGGARDPDPQFIHSLEPGGELCERQAGMDDPAIQLRERFICIIRNMLARYRAWTTGPSPRLTEDAVLKLLVYFNGGLNSPKDAIQTAVETYRHVEDKEIYPIYMVWPTGPVSSYGEDVLEVRAGRWTPPQTPSTLATVPVRPVSDLLRGLASTPAAWTTSFYEFRRTNFGLGNEAYSMARDRKLLALEGEEERIELGHNLYFDHTDDLHTGVLNVDRVNRDPRPGASAARTAEYIYFALTAPVRVLSTPFMIGFGEAGWGNMVRRTRTSVRAVREFPPESERAKRPSPTLNCMDANLDQNAEMLQRCYPRGSGGFARFFQWIESCTTGQPIAEGADPCPLPLSEEERTILRDKLRIIMIGHSMGTIVVNELLQASRYPNLPYEALVYMAGAASVQETADAVVPLLRDNKGCTKFYGLMLHPLNESRESTGAGLLVSGSLLTYIDEFIETPKTLPDRTVGQWHNLRLTRHLFPDDMQHWMLLRVYDREPAPPGNDGKRAYNPTTHGAFNDHEPDQEMGFWEERAWKPEEVNFHAPKSNCERLFQDRLEAARTKAQLTGMPSGRPLNTRSQEQ